MLFRAETEYRSWKIMHSLLCTPLSHRSRMQRQWLHPAFSAYSTRHSGWLDGAGAAVSLSLVPATGVRPLSAAVRPGGTSLPVLRCAHPLMPCVMHACVL